MGIKDAINLGLGALALTKEKAEEIAKELVKKGKLLESESKALAEELMKRGQEERVGLEDKLQKIVQDTVKKLNLATKEDIDILKKEIFGKKAKNKKTR